MRLLLAAAILLLAADARAAMKHLEKASRRLAAAIAEAGVEKGAPIAVLPFRDGTGRASELGRLAAEAVGRELLETRCCATVDRDYVSALLKEAELAAVGLTEQKGAVRLGKLAGARYLAAGTLAETGKRRATLRLKLIETETGLVRAASEAEVKLDAALEELLRKPAALDPLASSAILGDAPASAKLLDETGPEGCRFVESRGEASLSSAPAARAAALSLARRRAAAALAFQPPPERLDFTDDVLEARLEALVRDTRSGRVEAESIVREERSGDETRLTLRSCLRPAKAGRDADFRLELLVNQGRFLEGDEARTVALSNRDAYLYLFSVDLDGKLLAMLPAASVTDNRLKAGKAFAFPDDAQRQAGLTIRAELPPGAAHSVELVRAVAVKRPLGAELGGAGTYSELVRRIEAAGHDWAEDVRVFTVRQRSK